MYIQKRTKNHILSTQILKYSHIQLCYLSFATSHMPAAHQLAVFLLATLVSVFHDSHSGSDTLVSHCRFSLHFLDFLRFPHAGWQSGGSLRWCAPLPFVHIFIGLFAVFAFFPLNGLYVLGVSSLFIHITSTSKSRCLWHCLYCFLVLPTLIPCFNQVSLLGDRVQVLQSFFIAFLCMFAGSLIGSWVNCDLYWYSNMGCVWLQAAA